MLRDVVRRVRRRAAPAAPGSVGELVFSGPLPPARTGVATYDRAVLDGLRRIGFFDRHRMDVLWPIEPKHATRLPGYRLGVFELGNNVEFHLEAYRAAFLAQSSLIVLHDLALDDFVRGLRTLGDPLGFMATREAAALRLNLHSPDVVRNEPLREPWCAHVARRARGIIVHSAFCARYLEEAGCRTPVFVVPHPIVESETDMRRAIDRGAELRAERAAKGMRSLVVAPGDLNQAKRLDALLAAAHELDDDVHVALVGRRIEGYDVDRVVDAARLADRVALASDVSDEDFRGWLAAADVVVDLRFPHRGEVSGSLIRAMQAGKASDRQRDGDVPRRARRRGAPRGARPDEPARAGRTDPLPARGPRAADRGWARRREHTWTRLRDVRGHREGLRARDRGDPRAWSATPRTRRWRSGARRSPTSAPTRPTCAKAWAWTTRERSPPSAERHRTSGIARSPVARLERTASDLRIHPRSHDITAAMSVTERTSESLSLRPVARVRELYAYREILLNLVRKELKVKYTASVLGAVWSILNPIVFLAVFTFVVKVLGNATPHYPVFLLSGLLAWNLFSVAVGNGTRCVIDNGNLVKKVAFPREILPLVRDRRGRWWTSSCSRRCCSCS